MKIGQKKATAAVENVQADVNQADEELFEALKKQKVKKRRKLNCAKSQEN